MLRSPKAKLSYDSWRAGTPPPVRAGARRGVTGCRVSRPERCSPRSARSECAVRCVRVPGAPRLRPSVMNHERESIGSAPAHVPLPDKCRIRLRLGDHIETSDLRRDRRNYTATEPRISTVLAVTHNWHISGCTNLSAATTTSTDDSRCRHQRDDERLPASLLHASHSSRQGGRRLGFALELPQAAHRA